MTKPEAENLESLQVSLQQNPDSLTFARVAEALMATGRLEEAIQVCEEGVKRHPTYVTGHMVLGKCYMQKKYFDQAEKEFKRVLLFDPKYLAAHRCYGDLMREIGWENTCEMSYRKILHIDPLDRKVQNVVDEFTRKAESRQPAPPAAPKTGAPATEPRSGTSTRRPPLTTVPLHPEDLLEVTAEPAPAAPKPEPKIAGRPPKQARKEEPPPAPAGESPAPDLPEAKTPPLTGSDEARFSSILDDIFREEQGEESGPPPDQTERVVAPRAEQPEQESKPEPAPWRRTAKTERPKPEEKSARPAPTNRPPSAPASPRQPVDFEIDFDETPPSPTETWAPSDFGRSSTEASSPFHEETPRPPSRTVQEIEATSPPPEPNAGTRDKIVTPTLGEIYAAQGQYAKAIGVFELLSRKDPTNRNFREKIDYLKRRLQETQNAG